MPDDDTKPNPEDTPTSPGSPLLPEGTDTVPGDQHGLYRQGDTIGPYKLLGLIGEGGFGLVYEAEQRSPIVRRVALKVIRPGMDSMAVIARFEAERQALAMMDHPCVARVFDGGTTPSGRPYFVMELVRGISVSEHCDRHKLDIRQRLELFARICDAVQHAHTKGVIHRDLKPSNILVEYEDGSSTPKVIDFGVAKALDQKLSSETIFTARGQLIGTPEYMSPEQAEMSAQDIDTRSDVYSLGVILYELLTGGRPFEAEDLRRGGLEEIRRIIRDVEPPRPSTKLSSLATPTGTTVDLARSIVSARCSDVRTLTGILRRDLDWVVMKCLEKNRERRYDTANELATEIRRFLDGEPVEAGPPGVAYRASKFVARYRAMVVLTGVVLTAIIALATISTIGFIVVRDARDTATTALSREESALKKERAKSEELEAALAELRSYFEADTRRVQEQAGLLEVSPGDSSALLQLISDSRIDLTTPLSAPRLITVHHSGVPFTDDALEPTLEHIRTIRTAHMRNQWFDIGYHFIVDPAGRVWAGRSLLERGAHVANENDGNIGVMVLGDFYAHALSPDAAAATTLLLDQLCDAFQLPRDAVATHRELSATADPGPPLQKTIEHFRAHGADADVVPFNPASLGQAPEWALHRLVESVQLRMNRDLRTLNVVTRRMKPEQPIVGRIDVHIFDLAGEQETPVPEVTMHFAVLPGASVMLSSFQLESGRWERTRQAFASVDPDVECCEWLRGSAASRGFPEELQQLLSSIAAESSIARVEIAPDPEFAGLLRDAGLDVSDDALLFDPVSHRIPVTVLQMDE